MLVESNAMTILYMIKERVLRYTYRYEIEINKNMTIQGTFVAQQLDVYIRWEIWSFCVMPSLVELARCHASA